MSEHQKTVAVVIQTNSVITDVGPLCEKLVESGYRVVVFANADTSFKPQINPKLHNHLDSLKHHEVVWYKDNQELANKLEEYKVSVAFCEETWPFIFNPELFQNRSYKIVNLVHSVDNFHVKAIPAGAIDVSIVPYERYGEYLDWDKKDYVALGLPKYDVVANLNPEKIRAKYKLPKKYILLLVPNNNLLNVGVIYRIVRAIKKRGYEVVLKGKYPKCHKRLYGYMGSNYFLNDVSFYPFITHELIVASSGVIGFDTTAVEEILMCERPLVNLSVKPYRDKASKEGNFKQFVPMWNAPYCLDINFFDYRGLAGLVKPLPEFMPHLEKQFDYQKIQKEVFTTPGGASERIVAWLKDQGI